MVREVPSCAPDPSPVVAFPQPAATGERVTGRERDRLLEIEAELRKNREMEGLARPGCGTGMLLVMAASTALLILGTVLSWAQETPPAGALTLPPAKVEASPLIGGKSADPCVAVDAAGHHAGDADCAAQKLQDAARSAQDRAGQARDIADPPTATSHDTRIGVANEAATRQRLGNNFGKSVLPQRPVPPPAAPSPFTRQ